MANHKSTPLKRIRQAEKRRIHNRTYRNRARTLVKKARTVIATKDLVQAKEATRLAVKDLDMAASRGTIHPRNAAHQQKPFDETSGGARKRVITLSNLWGNCSQKGAKRPFLHIHS